MNRNLTPNGDIEKVEKYLLQYPQIDLPLTHRFADGVYYREIFMPAGIIVIGHEHLTEHHNIILAGRCRLLTDGHLHEVSAPLSFVSKPGVRKILFILEDMIWATVHATHETDINKLENLLIKKSPAYLANEKEIQCLLQQ